MIYQYKVSTEDGYHISMLCNEDGEEISTDEYADRWDPSTFMPQDIVFENRD